MNTVDRWLLEPAPARRLGVLRILVAGYATVFLVARWPSYWSSTNLPARRVEGVGVLWWLDDRLCPGAVQVVLVVTVLVGIMATIGWRFRFTGPAFAILFLGIATYRLSFGHVIHTEHLPALHLLVVGFTRASDAVSLDARRQSASWLGGPNEHERYGWPIKIMVLITVVAYMLAGWAKVRHGGLDWMVGDVLRNQVAFDNLRKILLGSTHSPIGARLVAHDWVFPPFAVITVAVEILAFVVLFGRSGANRVWAVVAWGFHVGILATMAINFPYQVSFIAYAPLFRVEHTLRRFDR